VFEFVFLLEIIFVFLLEIIFVFVFEFEFVFLFAEFLQDVPVVADAALLGLYYEEGDVEFPAEVVPGLPEPVYVVVPDGERASQDGDILLELLLDGRVGPGDARLESPGETGGAVCATAAARAFTFRRGPEAEAVRRPGLPFVEATSVHVLTSLWMKGMSCGSTSQTKGKNPEMSFS